MTRTPGRTRPGGAGKHLPTPRKATALPTLLTVDFRPQAGREQTSDISSRPDCADLLRQPQERDKQDLSPHAPPPSCADLQVTCCPRPAVTAGNQMETQPEPILSLCPRRCDQSPSRTDRAGHLAVFLEQMTGWKTACCPGPTRFFCSDS